MTSMKKRTVTLHPDQDTDTYLIGLVRAHKEIHSKPDVLRLLISFGQSKQDEFEQYINAVTSPETTEEISIA